MDDPQSSIFPSLQFSGTPVLRRSIFVLDPLELANPFIMGGTASVPSHFFLLKGIRLVGRHGGRPSY
jgi:hypothetical protein